MNIPQIVPQIARGSDTIKLIYEASITLIPKLVKKITKKCRPHFPMNMNPKTLKKKKPNSSKSH